MKETELKQIEEMAKIAEDAIDNKTAHNCPYIPCRYRSSSVCCDVCHTIEALYNAGYRKASEIVTEVSTKIEYCMSLFEDDDDGYLLKKREFEFFMRELKKEYTEGGAE